MTAEMKVLFSKLSLQLMAVMLAICFIMGKFGDVTVARHQVSMYVWVVLVMKMKEMPAVWWAFVMNMTLIVVEHLFS